MFAKLIETLKANPRTLVFTEGSDARILEATARLKKDGFLTPILVGVETEVKAAAEPGREDALRRLAQIAFGRANDCVRLVLEDDPPIGELDLTLLSEVKRSEKGAIEVRLADRIRALEELLQAGAADDGAAAAFFAAVEEP